jgi:hypothetical protein
MNYTIIEDALTPEELEVVNTELEHEFPWFLHLSDVEDGDRFPFLCHTLMHRASLDTATQGVVNSDSFDFFKTIFDRLVPEHTTLLRASLNLSVHNSSDVGTVHTDHKFPHKNLIIYLGDSGAGTRLYDEQGQETDRIPGTLNTAVKFEGRHAQEFPREGVRLVVVFTYI